MSLRARTGILLCILLFLVEAACGGAVHRRDGLTPLTGPIIAVDDAGVALRVATDDVRVVPWDVIRDLEPDQTDPGLDERLARAERLWRARSRLQRQDATLAEPLFERLFEYFRGQTHETALIVAEGLLRCRLARGAHLSAVAPYLETARLKRAGISSDRFAELPSVLDADSSLCPGLVPDWAEVDGLERLAADLARYDAQNDDVIATIAALFRALALAQLRGESRVADGDVSGAPRHVGADLLRRLLETYSPQADERESARLRLLREIAGRPGWVEPWIRLRIGSSWLHERAEDHQRRGLVHLAHLPARYSSTNPYFAGLALARAADGLQTLGNEAGAMSLREELRRRFPAHPILVTESDQIRAPARKENI